MTASARTDLNTDLEDSSYDGVLENQLLSASLLICLGKRDCVERIPSEVLRRPHHHKERKILSNLNSPCLDKNVASVGIDDCVITRDEDGSVVKVAETMKNKEGCSSASGCGKENPWNLYKTGERNELG
ncbi:hypothetical protein Tco_0427430 [Tanacetum coccineum]